MGGHLKTPFLWIFQPLTGNGKEDHKNSSPNNTDDDSADRIPFTETRFYVPSSYSAGPDPAHRASPMSSSGSLSAISIVIIMFFVLLTTGLVIVGSWLLWRSHKQQILQSLSWVQFFRMDQRNGELEHGVKVVVIAITLIYAIRIYT